MIPIVVDGDLRPRGDGLPPLRYPGGAKEVILVSAGRGLWLFERGDYLGAWGAWQGDLEWIAEIEKETGERLHKGLFYYNLFRAADALARLYPDASRYPKSRDDFLALAREEDRLSYGEQAATYPAARQ